MVDQIVAEFHPHEVRLFGSYARGEAGVDSDVDLMVVMPYTGPSWRQASLSRGVCPRNFAVDIKVCSREEFQRRIEEEHSFYLDIMDEGILLYESKSDI